MIRPLPTLKERRDFLAMNKAARWVTDGFILQYKPNQGTNVQVGYTVSKKVGNAVVRNRVKRRLRALASRLLSSEEATMVLIGRAGAEKLDFPRLEKDLRWALRRLKQKMERT
ncbi:MAG: ribonuclease P protein component [Pseudomonadota bacterium]